MTHSLNDWLRVIRPHLDTALVSHEAFENIQQLAGFLPPLRAGFECRLAENNPQVDLITAFRFENNEPELLRGVISTLLKSGDVYPDPAWKRIVDFCSQWTDPSSCLFNGVKTFWLEFDLEKRFSRMPIPSLFITPSSSVTNSVEKLSLVMETALSLLSEAPPPQPLLTNLRSCFSYYQKIAMGIMLSRTSNAVRVTISEPEPHNISTYLSRIGWRDSTTETDIIFSQAKNLADAFKLAIDIGETVFPQIGLECYFHNSRYNRTAMKKFLNFLITKRLCTPEKRDAILAWPGHTDPLSGSEAWPADLIIAYMLQPIYMIGRFRRLFSHIKINFHPKQPTEAKAYLGFDHEWIDIGTDYPLKTMNGKDQ